MTKAGSPRFTRSTKIYKNVPYCIPHTPYPPPPPPPTHTHTHSHAHTLVHRRNVMGREGEEDKIIWNLWWVWIYILGNTTVLITYDCVTNSLADKSSIHNVCTHLQVTFSRFYLLMYWGWFIFILAGWSHCFCIWYSASMQSFRARAP